MSHYTHTGLLLGIGVILLCLAISAFFSLTEGTMLSISKLKAEHLKQKRGVVAKILSIWIEKPTHVLVALLICNNLTNIFVSVYADNLSHKLFGRSSIIAVSVVMTLLIVFFSDVLPKTIAKKFAIDLIIPVLKIFKIFYWLTWPVTQLITFLTIGIQKILFKDFGKIAPSITGDELKFLMQVGEKEGVIPEQKYSMLAGVFDLSKRTVKEILIPRPDMVALNQNATIADCIVKFKETGFSRLPLYEDKVDNIIGIIHQKDVLFATISSNEDLNKTLNTKANTLKRDVLFIPDHRPIDKVFQDMRNDKHHLAIVIDEYGGVSGLITMENIFEEIFGDICDEYDSNPELIHKTNDSNQFEVEAKIHINDFSEFFDLNVEELRMIYPQEFETLGGLIIDHYKKIPKVGEKFSLANLEIEILEVNIRRIRKVRVIRKN